jgi:hypothetical protein
MITHRVIAWSIANITVTLFVIFYIGWLYIITRQNIWLMYITGGDKAAEEGLKRVLPS